MAITLSDGATSITLPDDLLWADRVTWSPVSQTVAPSITGALIIDSGTRLNGRPVTLQGDERHAWMPYSTVLQLRAWAAIAGKEMVLVIGDTSFDVIFRHEEPPAVDLQPLVDYPTPDAQDWYFGTLKFTEI